MKVTAKRQSRVTVERDIEIVSQRLCTSSLHDGPNGGSLWITLKRKCCVCGGKFKFGDSVSLCMYLEDGQQFSGGAHTNCLPEERIAPLTAQEIARLEGLS